MRSMSLSKLNVYKACPKQYEYKHIANLGAKESPAMQRGIKIHEHLERLVNRAVAEGNSVLAQGGASVARIQDFLDDLVRLEPTNMVSEQAIAYDPTTLQIVPWDYKGPVVRAKLDLTFMTPHKPDVLFVLDWKTGQVYDKHTEEREFYAAICALYAKSLGLTFTHAQAMYVYADQGVVNPFNYMDQQNSARYSEDQLAKILAKWSVDMVTVGTAERFPYTPGQPQCKWCDYSKSRGGPCMF